MHQKMIATHSKQNRSEHTSL